MRRALLAVALAACGHKRAAPPAHDAAVPKPAPDAATPAVPAPDAAVDAAPAARLPERCRGVPARATVKALGVHDGVAGYYAHVSPDERWLAFDRAKACDVVPIGAAEARLYAAVWPKLGDVKVVALRVPTCDEPDPDTDACPTAVMVRTEDGDVLDAIDACGPVPEIGLHVAKVFLDQPSLLVSCVVHTGYGLEEELVLLHAVDGALKVQLRTRGGWGDHGPSDECAACKDHCWTQLDEARWKVIARSPTPVLETRAPRPYMEQVGDATGKPEKNVIRWALDPATGVFTATSKRRVKTTAGHDVCAPRILRSPVR